MKKIILKARLPLLILLTFFDGIVLWQYGSDNAFLYEFSRPYVLPNATPSETTIRLLGHIEEHVARDRYPDGFMGPVFRPLRPTPRQVAEYGGDCADRSRLLITMLHLHGIKASKVALYDDKEVPRHAVVEVDIGDRERMVVDALLGIYFPQPGDGYYDVDDLKNDEGILRARIDTLVSLGNLHLANYPYHKYTYKYPRTINWEKSALMRGMYGGLKVLMGDDVNNIRRPYLVERPALMVLCAILTLQLILALTYLPLSERWLRKASHQ